MEQLVDSLAVRSLATLASILGVVLPLVVRAHRKDLGRQESHASVWRIVVIGAGCGLAVYASLSFYAQAVPPADGVFRDIWHYLHGSSDVIATSDIGPTPDDFGPVRELYDQRQGPRVWGVLAVCGLCLIAAGASWPSWWQASPAKVPPKIANPAKGDSKSESNRGRPRRGR